MKALFVLLVLSTLAVVVAAIAMWWRLRQHLNKSDKALQQALQQIESEQQAEPEQEPVER